MFEVDLNDLFGTVSERVAVVAVVVAVVDENYGSVGQTEMVVMEVVPAEQFVVVVVEGPFEVNLS